MSTNWLWRFPPDFQRSDEGRSRLCGTDATVRILPVMYADLTHAANRQVLTNRVIDPSHNRVSTSIAEDVVEHS